MYYLVVICLYKKKKEKKESLSDKIEIEKIVIMKIDQMLVLKIYF